jgi:hypothetical protein
MGSLWNIGYFTMGRLYFFLVNILPWVKSSRERGKNYELHTINKVFWLDDFGVQVWNSCSNSTSQNNCSMPLFNS